MNALTQRAAQLHYDNQSPPEDDTSADCASEWADTLSDAAYAELARAYFDRADEAAVAHFLETAVLPAWRQHIDASNAP